MSNCQNKPCGCKKKNCGCEDKGLTTPSVCPSNVVNCPTPEPCSETYSDCCVIHTGDTIADIGINKGDRLCDILQRLTLIITNPDCIMPGSDCQSVLGFKSTSIGNTTAKFSWSPAEGATGYIVEYRKTTVATWTVNPAVTTLYDTISNLVANTDYYVRVKTTCQAQQSCYSVTLQITTKAI